MRSTLRFAATTLSLTALLACPLRANVLVVDASGAGAFTQISAAVAAASDDDVILVKSGTYTGFSISSTSLDVVADVGANVRVLGHVVVASIGATRTVTLTGLAIDATAGTPALLLSGSTGSIRVQGCVISGFDQPDCTVFGVDGGTSATVSSCTDVAFAGCTLVGGDAGDSPFLYGDNGGSGLSGDSANVALYDCVARGGAGGGGAPTCPAYGYAGDGGDGAFGRHVQVAFFSNSQVRGGRAGTASSLLGYDGCPGSGLRLIQSGTPSSNAIALQSTFMVGTPGSGTPYCLVLPGHVVVQPPDTFRTLSGAARRMTAGRIAREQQPARVDFFGQPGDQVRLVIAEATRFLYSTSARGVSLVRQRHPVPVLLAGTIGASGTLSYAWLVPDLGPGVQSRRFFLQAEFVDAAGQKTLGTPTTLVLLDSAF